MDNEASTALKWQIKKIGATYYLVEPHIHRVNAVERAIWTFKNNLIAGLCSTDANFPISQWHKLLEQATLTLNVLRTFKKHIFQPMPIYLENLIWTRRLWPHLVHTHLSTKTQSHKKVGHQLWTTTVASNFCSWNRRHPNQRNSSNFSKILTMSPVEEVADNAQNLITVIQQQTAETPINPALNCILSALQLLAGIF